MKESIVQTGPKQCYLCGRQYGLECHHLWAGVANRKISDKNGLWVWLCHKCHTGTDGAQYDKQKNLELKQDGQRAYEKTHTRAEFMQLFGRNYL